VKNSRKSAEKAKAELLLLLLLYLGAEPSSAGGIATANWLTQASRKHNHYYLLKQMFEVKW